MKAELVVGLTASLVGVAGQAVAVVAYDESIHGDLSDSKLHPTPVTMVVTSGPGSSLGVRNSSPQRLHSAPHMPSLSLRPSCERQRPAPNLSYPLAGCSSGRSFDRESTSRASVSAAPALPDPSRESVSAGTVTTAAPG